MATIQSHEGDMTLTAPSPSPRGAVVMIISTLSFHVTAKPTALFAALFHVAPYITVVTIAKLGPAPAFHVVIFTN